MSPCRLCKASTDSLRVQPRQGHLYDCEQGGEASEERDGGEGWLSCSLFSLECALRCE